MYSFKHICIPLHYIRVEIIINNGLIECETEFVPVNCLFSRHQQILCYLHSSYNFEFPICQTLVRKPRVLNNNRMFRLQVPFNKYGNEANKFYTINYELHIIIIVPKIYLMPSGIHESPVGTTANYQLQYLLVFCASMHSLY